MTEKDLADTTHLGAFIRLTAPSGEYVTWTVVQGPYVFLKATPAQYQTRLAKLMLLPGTKLEVYDPSRPDLAGQPVVFSYGDAELAGVYVSK